MCGIIAVVMDKITPDAKNLFKSLLLHDVVRGPHSTGVISVGSELEVYKKAVPSYDFLDMRGADEVIGRATTALIGHNRYATLGAKTSKNAHPFQHGDIALVHNGTLKNKATIDPQQQFDTDSEAIAYNIANEDAKSVLEELTGAYALVWTDGNTVSIAKNTERPLHYFKVEKKSALGCKGFVLSSEKGLGDWLLEREGFTVIDDYPLLEGKLMTYDLRTANWVTEDFTIKKGSFDLYPHTGNVYSYDEKTYTAVVVEVKNGNIHAEVFGKNETLIQPVAALKEGVTLKVGDFFTFKKNFTNTKGGGVVLSTVLLKKH